MIQDIKMTAIRIQSPEHEKKVIAAYEKAGACGKLINQKSRYRINRVWIVAKHNDVIDAYACTTLPEGYTEITTEDLKIFVIGKEKMEKFDAAKERPKRLLSELGPNECVHCKTQEQFDAIIGLNPKNTCSKTLWDMYKEKTCYYPKGDVGKGEYAKFNFYEREDFTIYPAEDFLPEEKELIGSFIHDDFLNPESDYNKQLKKDAEALDKVRNKFPKEQDYKVEIIKAKVPGDVFPTQAWLNMTGELYANACGYEFISATFNPDTTEVEFKCGKKLPEQKINVSIRSAKDVFDEMNQPAHATKENLKVDMVNHPSHYTQHKFECIDVIAEVTKDLKGIEAHCIGNIFKYLWRFKQKNGVEDVEKAEWYVGRLIKELKKPE